MEAGAGADAGAGAGAGPSVLSASKGSGPALQLSTSQSHFIEEGDLILVYLSHNRNPLPVVVHAGATHINSFGAFPHSSAFLGKPYGCRVNSLNGRGFVYVLRPTPELWTLSLPHRTQILYQADIAFITQQLRLLPGSRIIEAGTGSGSFTHALARTVGRAHQIHRFQGIGSESVGRNDPREAAAAQRVQALSQLDDTVDDVSSDGRVFSFEFHAQRFAKAKVEFAAHGLSGVVRMTHRNVCKDGFALSKGVLAPAAEPHADNGASEPSSSNGPSPPTAQDVVYPIVDAIFLDLPAPWEAVPFATKHLDSSRTTRICCFSPCIEQVLKTVQALNAHGFSDVQTWEVLMREVESTPLAKVAKGDDDWSDDDNDEEPEQVGRRANDAEEDDDEEADADAEAVGDNPEAAEDQEASSSSGKRAGRQNGKNGKAKAQPDSKLGKRKREDAASQASLHKARWGLERPRDVTSIIRRILKVEDRKEMRRLAQVTKAKEQRAKRQGATAAQPTEGEKEQDPSACRAKVEDGDVSMDSESVPTSASITVAPSMPRLYEPATVYGRIITEMRGHTSYLTFGTKLARVAGAEIVPAPAAGSGVEVPNGQATTAQSSAS